MKNKSINKYILSLACFLTIGLASCDDFLTVYPTNSITEEDFFTEQGDLDQVRAAAYAKFASSDVIGRILYWGEIRSDNFEINKLSYTEIMYMKDNAILEPTNRMFDWSTLYTGINYCNKVLEKGQSMVDNDVDPSFDASNWRTLKAEILGLRALYYLNLVRAYRNVPFTDKSISTDAEAMAAIVSATPGEVILGQLINELEEYKDFAPENYGNSADNKGRFTRNSLRALLADMYLWRGCMLKHNSAKTAGGMTTQLSDDPNTCFEKAIEHCNYLIDELKEDYFEEKEEERGQKTQIYSDSDPVYANYPLYIYELAAEDAQDLVYQTVWGTGNSRESIFDIQYDGTNSTNSSIGSYYSSYSGSEISASVLKLNKALFQEAIDGNDRPKTKGFGRTDIRLLQTAAFDKDEVQVIPYHKNIATTIVIKNTSDMTEGFSSTPAYRQDDKNNMCQPIYRLSDVMLIKAEAIARKGATGDQLTEGVKIVDALYARYNPKLEGSTYSQNELGTATATADRLLTWVYQERQREFIGEGKRWFDLVREAEYNNSTEESISLMGGSSTLKTRLRQLWAMYVPIYSEEIKVNKQLVQNPVWDKYTDEKDK